MLDLTTLDIGLDYVLFGWYGSGVEIQVLGRSEGREIGEELRTNHGSYKVTKVFYCPDGTWVVTARR